MNEKHTPEFTNGFAEDREVKQVTHRDYATYLSLFNLSESYLAKIETVVDIGGGFSNFTEVVRQNNKNLRAIAVDPIYQSIQANPNLTPEQLKQQEKIIALDFNPNYRGEEKSPGADLTEQEDEIYKHFIEEVSKNSADYIAASHQNLPFENNSVDLVLASNSIIRRENKYSIIKKALQECLRVIKENGEIRIVGSLDMFTFNSKTNNIELWFNGILTPNGPWVKEFEKTGHYSDPELMQVFIGLEKIGVTFYGVIVAVKDKYDNFLKSFDTLVIRKDTSKPDIDLLTPETDLIELRKLQFQDTDGFNIPSVVE